MDNVRKIPGYPIDTSSGGGETFETFLHGYYVSIY